MKINQIKNTQKFNGLYDNKLLLSSLETISDHGASFSCVASFVGALGLRPLAISLTPKTNKENKKALSADSIASGIIKLLVALGVSLPIEKTINKINENPKAFLKPKTIENLSKNELDFLSQSLKMGANFISAIPKSILSVSIIPLILDLIPKNKEKEYNMLSKYSFQGYKNQVSFKGNKTLELTSLIIDSKNMQNFAKKYSYNKKNIAKNASVATDILLSTTSAMGVRLSKKIEDKNKKPLILNKILSSAISIFAGCKIDEITQKLGENFIENFKNANLNNPKLSKYLEGLNILRPTIIFALIYYGIIPVITTFISDKLSESNKN